MSAAKKFHHYKTEEASKDKQIIDQYVKKIEMALREDPDLQKKAALIIEQMINSKHKK